MKIKLAFFLFGLLLLGTACQQQENPILVDTPPAYPYSWSRYQVHPNTLHQVRLGDGVPLRLNVSIRWRIQDPALFQRQFASIDTFNTLILKPRALELSRQSSNAFASVDSVFSTQRNRYISTIKDRLAEGLGERGIEIREIILSDVGFPQGYTKAMEEASLRQRELERIRLQQVVDVEQASANRAKAEADGKVAIARAEAEGRLQKIQAKMEGSRRQSELAKAETQAQVEKLQTAATAEKRRLLNEAELDKARRFKDLDIQRQRELDQLVVEKQNALAERELERQARFAQICRDHPAFADYLVDKELASKVEVAFLPTGTDANIFTNLIKQRLPQPGTRE